MAFDDILQKAINLHNQGKLAEAEQLYRQVLETAPKNAWAMHFLAMIAVARGAYDNAISLLYQAVDIDKKAAPFRFNLAMALQGAQFYSEATEQYKTAMKLDKDFAAEALNNIGNIYKITGQVKDAEKAYKKSIEADEKKSFYALNGLGILYREAGKYEKAMECFQRAIDVENSFADAYANLATTLRVQGRLFEALPLYEKALGIDGNNPFIWNSFGLALEADKQLAAAMRAYQKAAELKDDFADAHAHIGALLMLDEDNLRAAEDELRLATKLDENNEDAWVNLGVVLYKRELYMEAMECYRKAILLNPKNVEVCNNLAVAVHQSGDLTEAAGLCFNAMAIDRDFAEVHNTLAAILADMYRSDKELAIGTAKAWVKHCPKNAIAKHTLAAFSGDAKKEKADDEYVKELFDGFAESFNKTLAKLEYGVPKLIASRLEKNGGGKKDILDLGCGTGLVGEQIKKYAAKMVGVDLSPKMLEQANKTGVYDDIICSEAISFLGSNEKKFDVIVAGDVLCYFGKLNKIFAYIKLALKDEGRAIFSLEALGGKAAKNDFLITESGRFAHSESYIRKSLIKAGFKDKNIVITDEILRLENQKPVKGFLVEAKNN